MLVERRYNRQNALEYARRWALSRNPLFVNYTGFGGDCTNFVSQCVFAGSCEMNFTPVFGWYYLNGDTRTASWTGVEYFYNFIVDNAGVGPFAIEVRQASVEMETWYNSPMKMGTIITRCSSAALRMTAIF